MTESNEDDDGIPLLQDVVRAGREAPSRRRDQVPPTLSEDDIEAIAARVVERYVPHMEQAVARAIREALAEQEAEPDADKPG